MDEIRLIICFQGKEVTGMSSNNHYKKPCCCACSSQTCGISTNKLSHQPQLKRACSGLGSGLYAGLYLYDLEDKICTKNARYSTVLQRECLSPLAEVVLLLLHRVDMLHRMCKDSLFYRVLSR